MNNKLRKMVTLGLTTVMAFGCVISVNAADPDPTTQTVSTNNAPVQADGSAALEGYINDQVFSIEVPTQAVMDRIVSYTVDPQGLVKETNAKKYAESGLTVADSTVLFQNYTDGAITGLSGTSDALTITNKSSRAVDLAVDVKLTASANDAYNGGYSTTADFSGTNDSAKGLYLGLYATGEDARALTETSSTFDNVLLSAGDKYVKDWSAEDGYTYELDENATDLPTYSFIVVGATNPDAADNTFASIASDGTITTKGMPSITLKFTPKLSTAKEALAVWDGDTLYVYKASATDNGGFGSTAPAASDVKVNGKELKAAPTMVEGYVAITWEQVWKAFGYTKEEDVAEDVANGITVVELKVGGVDYIAQIQ